jgi:putative ABC transport system ATP-binding protein
MNNSLFHSQSIEHAPLLTGVDKTVAIELRKVKKVFKTPSGDFTALKSIDLKLNGGEFVGITGKSGSGKSTLINMITGIDHPTSGEIWIGKTMVNHLTESQMAMWRGRNLGIVFQFYQLLPMLSLLENTMLPMDFCNMYPSAEREKRAMDLLRRVGLENIAHKMPAAISGGQQQAAAVARALANDPMYLIADEPTGNLDSRTAETIFEIFEELSHQGKTIIMITHDPSLAKRTQRQVVLSDGEIINHWIVQVFPMLTHPLMMRATQALKASSFPAGSILIRQGTPLSDFNIITHGEVILTLENTDGKENIIEKLGTGRYFGELELLNESPAPLTVRAGHDGAEILAIPGKILLELVSSSAAFRAALIQSSQALLARFPINYDKPRE